MVEKKISKTKTAKTTTKSKKPARVSTPKIVKEEKFFEEAPEKKPKMNIEARNAMGEIKEILSPCIKCGMCKSLCPVFKTLKLEEISPRGHSIMLNEGMLSELVFKCNLCKACEKKCPLNLKICDAMKKAREVLVIEDKGLASNKEMIESIRKNGTPFEKTGEINPDKLYCC